MERSGFLNSFLICCDRQVVSGMEGEDVLAERRAVEMDIDLRGRDAFMAQHLLDGTEVGASFKKVGGERVAQCVGRYVFPDSRSFSEILDYLKDSNPCELPSAAVEEKDIGAVGFHVEI